MKIQQVLRVLAVFRLYELWDNTSIRSIRDSVLRMLPCSQYVWVLYCGTLLYLEVLWGLTLWNTVCNEVFRSYTAHTSGARGISAVSTGYTFSTRSGQD